MGHIDYLVLPLVLALVATAPGLAPVRRAFARRPAPALAPGEHLVGVIRPDRRGLRLGALGLALGLGVAAHTGLWAVLPFGAGALVWLVQESRAHWVVTDRRLIAASGAQVPLRAIRRIRAGGGFLAVQAAGAQSLCLVGVPAAQAVAQALCRQIARGQGIEVPHPV